jgi:hypothetical protein
MPKIAKKLQWSGHKSLSPRHAKRCVKLYINSQKNYVGASIKFFTPRQMAHKILSQKLKKIRRKESKILYCACGIILFKMRRTGIYVEQRVMLLFRITVEAAESR